MCNCCDCKRERYPNGELVQSKEERYDEDARIESPTEVEIGSEAFYAVVGRNLDLYPDDEEDKELYE
jgi:hypothetical protein